MSNVEDFGGFLDGQTRTVSLEAHEPLFKTCDITGYWYNIYIYIYISI